MTAAGADRGGLVAELTVELGPLHLRAAVSVARGETVAVLGPNGAGKTTLLRALAGLQPIDDGYIGLAGTTLDGGARGPWVPPECRPVGMVFQDALLFPHLSALDNVAFGLRARGRGRRAARADAQDALDRLGLAEAGGRRPAQLSGGQAQRVALARALVLEPSLLLLDEPLSSLDVTTRAATRRELRHILDGYEGSCLFVTHDAVDAIALADRLVIVEAGRAVQQGTPAEVVARPRSAFAADLVGVNLFSGRATGGMVQIGSGMHLATASEAEGDVFISIHPRAVTLHRDDPAGSSSRNVWRGVVRGLDAVGGRVRVRVDVGGRDPAAGAAIVAEVTPAAVQDLGLGEGRVVWAAVKATEIDVYPR